MQNPKWVIKLFELKRRHERAQQGKGPPLSEKEMDLFAELYEKLESQTESVKKETTEAAEGLQSSLIRQVDQPSPPGEAQTEDIPDAEFREAPKLPTIRGAIGPMTEGSALETLRTAQVPPEAPSPDTSDKGLPRDRRGRWTKRGAGIIPYEEQQEQSERGGALVPDDKVQRYETGNEMFGQEAILRLTEIRDAIRALSGDPQPGTPARETPAGEQPAEPEGKRPVSNLAGDLFSVLSQESASPHGGAQSLSNLAGMGRGMTKPLGKMKAGFGKLRGLFGKKKGIPGLPKGITQIPFKMGMKPPIPPIPPVGGAAAGAAGAGGAGAAAGGAGAAAGAAGGGTAAAGLAAAGGPVGIAVAGIVILGTAAVEAGKQVYQFARAQEQEIRKLAEVGGHQAAAIAQLDAQRVGRDIKTAGETGETSTELVSSLNNFENSLQKVESAATNIMNMVGSDLLDMVQPLVDIAGAILKAIEMIYNILPWRLGNMRSEKPEAPQTAWDFVKGLEEEQKKMKAPKWPQGPVGNSPYIPY